MKRKADFSKSENLVLDHNDKTEHGLHYRMLKFYV